MSKALSQRNMRLSIYEKKLSALVTAVNRWRPCLEKNPFIIKINHQRLKYLLEQRITTPLQQKWLTKLLGLCYEIQYKKGDENVMIDALSRRGAKIVVCHVTSQIYKDGILRFKGRMYVGETRTIRQKLIEALHSSQLGGHSGYQANYSRVKALFFWLGMKKQFHEIVNQCDVCKRCKDDHIPYLGLQQPLPEPKYSWSYVSLDFIEGLPKSDGKEVILMDKQKIESCRGNVSQAYGFPQTKDLAPVAFIS
ncbi:hypothetical protein ACH5RR_040497 [Cinchona calisaya]|uniref:Integrase zinc-binding domain-containing protein n=1 Tax=Cinchona calisaya TaxID=153742 RepID=A0ABD2XUJ4_9GENT